MNLPKWVYGIALALRLIIVGSTLYFFYKIYKAYVSFLDNKLMGSRAGPTSVN